MDERIQDALLTYTRDLFAQEDDTLAWIRSESEARGLPQIHIHPDDGRLIQFLLKAVGARRVIEVGTLAGYSGTWIARALPADGKLITLEYDPAHAKMATEAFKRAGVADRVEIRQGKALESLQKMSSDVPYDAIFIDANKDDYPSYLAWAIDHIRPGGLIAAHNAFFHGTVVGVEGVREAYLVEGMKTFNQMLARDKRLFGTIIPIGDGLAAAIRL